MVNRYDINDASEKLAGATVIAELDRLRSARSLSEASHAINVHPSRLTEILSGKRPLSFYFLHKLVDGGYVSIDQIMQGRRPEDLPDDQREVVLRLMLDKATVEAVTKAIAKAGKDKVLTVLGLIG